MRVLDTVTILAAMAQVSPRERRLAQAASAAPASASADDERPSGARTRSCHRPPATPAQDPGEPGDHDGGPRRVPTSSLVVVPQGVIPVIVVSSRLAAASRAHGCLQG
ncbi:MAG TPA: hypothetical protein VHE35_26610 [Kofleriaceae bacterium]|nr:hypothetical protein [Kofleriaceae bacterium]